MPKLIHYRSKCIGCGICQQMQPEYWRMSKRDGKATLLDAQEKKGIYQRDILSIDLRQTAYVVQACAPNVIKLIY